MNKVILTGRTTKDIELKYTISQTPVVNFTLAVNRNFKNANGEYDTDFFNCMAFGKLAETIKNHVNKGNKLGLEGRLQARSYQNKEGHNVYVTEVIVENIEFLEAKKQNNASKEEITSIDAPKELDDPFVEIDDNFLD